MLATVKLKELIDGKEFGEISEVYANNLPKELEENTDKTIVLLTESNPSLDLSGNNTFFSKTDRVEVQIFYKADIDFDIEAFEMKLLKFLKLEHYSITDMREHSIDPDTLQITATAIPDKVALTNNQFLAATLVPCTTASKVTFRAEGIFLDKAEGTPMQYDGFNYGISISSGAADAMLTWNPAVLEIDKFFVEKLQNLITSKDLAKGELKFTMDQSNGTGDFLISFYIKDKSKIPENWSDMEKMIQFTATQKAQ